MSAKPYVTLTTQDDKKQPMFVDVSRNVVNWLIVMRWERHVKGGWDEWLGEIEGVEVVWEDEQQTWRASLIGCLTAFGQDREHALLNLDDAVIEYHDRIKDKPWVNALNKYQIRLMANYRRERDLNGPAGI